MQNFIAAEAVSSEALWAWFSARSAVDEAIGALEDAGAALRPLVEESDWQARGVQSLHLLIVDLKARATAEIGELTSRLWEIEAVAS